MDVFNTNFCSLDYWINSTNNNADLVHANEQVCIVICYKQTNSFQIKILESALFYRTIEGKLVRRESVAICRHIHIVAIINFIAI